MLRSASKFSRYRQLELGILLKPCGPLPVVRHSSSSGHARKGRFGILKTFTAIAVVTGGTLSYAKYDPEFREWLNSQVPYSSDAINILFQEDKSLSERFDSYLDSVQDWFGSWFSSDDAKPLNKTDDAPIVKHEVIPYTAPPSAIAPLLDGDILLTSHPHDPSEKPWKEIRVLAPHDDVRTIASIDKPKKQETKSADPKVTTPKKLADLEKEITQNTKVAVETYNEAINSIREQARFVKELVSSDLNRLPPQLWHTLRQKSELRDSLMTRADENAHNAQVKMQEMEKLLAVGDIEAPASVRDQLQRNMKRMKADIDKACQLTEDEMFSTSVTKDLWPRVQEARKHWQDELEVIFPGIALDDPNVNTMADEIGQFVLHSFINVQYYQKELAKLEMSADKKLRDAIEKAATTNDSSTLVAAAVEAELENERRELEIQYQRRAMELRSACEQEVRKQLRVQTEIQADHLRDSIKLREMEIERDHRRELGRVLSEENTKYQISMAALLGRMRGIQNGLQEFVQVDKSAQEAQDLWIACQILYRNLQSSTGLRPLGNEVKSIQKIGESDELVQLVLKGLPTQVITRGVYPQSVLRERFLKVEKVARMLAVVPETGGSLPMYLLSWIQGKLIVNCSEAITQAELEDQPTAHEHLNNYDLLSRARYWMDRGDLTQALRYMNLLEGASKSIALDWMKEARVYLECQQAATILVTHASAKGLMYS